MQNTVEDGLKPPLAEGAGRSRTNRVDTTSLALADLIDRQKLRPGDQLPTERQLVDAMGVGRSTVREVIRQFQARGVVEARVGSGTFLLRAVSACSIHVPLVIDMKFERDSLLRTLEVRRAIEAEASALAARRRSADQLAEIERRLLVMEQAHLARGSAGPEDLALHLSIYDASQNPMFRELLAQIREPFERFFNKPFNRPDFAGRSFPLHRDLFDAILGQDPDGARGKTLAILAIVEDDLKAMSQ